MTKKDTFEIKRSAHDLEIGQCRLDGRDILGRGRLSACRKKSTAPRAAAAPLFMKAARLGSSP
ncbi:MAG: hypothetical protein ACREMB_18215 [Candidatus Rokuibacteriota bacterium]